MKVRESKLAMHFLIFFLHSKTYGVLWGGTGLGRGREQICIWKHIRFEMERRKKKAVTRAMFVCIIDEKMKTKFD